MMDRRQRRAGAAMFEAQQPELPTDHASGVRKRTIDRHRTSKVAKQLKPPNKLRGARCVEGHEILGCWARWTEVMHDSNPGPWLNQSVDAS